MLRQAEGLLRRLEEPTPDRRREARAVEVLERIGTAEARRMLKGLSGGIPEVSLTRDARDALRRLSGSLP